MANGYSNSRRGGARWRSSNPGLDTLEQILGITGNIANRVQDTRDRRDAYNQRYLATLTEGFEKITDNNILQQRLDSLVKFKEEKIGNATAESMDMFNLMEQRLKNQMANNTDFDMKYQSMIDKHKGVADWVQMMYDYNKEGTTEEQRAEIRGGKDEKQFRLEEEANFKKMMQTYSYDLRNWYGKHGNRIDPYMMNDMVTSQSYMKSILDNWRADDKIDETEYNLYFSGISTGNYQDLKAFEDRRQDLADNLAATDIKQFQALKEQFDALGRASSTGSLSNLLYAQYIDPNMVGGDEEGYTEITPETEGDLITAQINIYEELKKLNSSITGSAYQDLMVRDESFEKVPEAYGFKGSWDDWRKNDYKGIATQINEETSQATIITPEDALPEGVERPKEGQTSKVVVVKDEIDKELGLPGFEKKIIHAEKPKIKPPSAKINNLHKKYTDYSNKLKQIYKNSPNNAKAINKVKESRKDILSQLNSEGYNVGLFGELTKLPKREPILGGAGRQGLRE
tara:strand:- start:2957 stop:4495 length:1539 start_codon:yes stop_codon:yes gene_type:complete